MKILGHDWSLSQPGNAEDSPGIINENADLDEYYAFLDDVGRAEEALNQQVHLNT